MTKAEEKFEKKWFKGINEFCKKCAKDCKQSSKVEVVECPEFTGMDKEQKKEAKTEEINSKLSEFGHRFSGKAGKIDKLMGEGHKRTQILMLLHIKESRLKAHLDHLSKAHGWKGPLV